jgi:hypothetical protein
MTNSFSFIVRTALRITREDPLNPPMAMARMTLPVPGPGTAMIVSMIKSQGKAEQPPAGKNFR